MKYELYGLVCIGAAIWGMHFV